MWGRSIQEMSANVLIGRSIYGVVVIDGSLYSRFYGIYMHGILMIRVCKTAGSNLWMVRPSLMLVVNLPIICTQMVSTPAIWIGCRVGNQQ